MYWAQESVRRPGPWLWQGWPWGAAAAEGGRNLNRLEGTRLHLVLVPARAQQAERDLVLAQPTGRQRAEPRAEGEQLQSPLRTQAAWLGLG